MKIYVYVIFIFISISIFASSSLQMTVDSFSVLLDEIDIYSEETSDERFDLNNYFTVLDNLSMEEGYLLDFVYENPSGGAHPVLISINTDYDEAIEIFWEQVETSGSHPEEYWYDYLKHIKINDNEDGYFQYVLLRIMGNQFLLFWHSNYLDQTIICDREALMDILNNPDDFGNTLSELEAEKAKNIDLTPVIEIGEEEVLVEVITFTKWGGFQRHKFLINRNFPHKLTYNGFKTLVYYNCHVRF